MHSYVTEYVLSCQKLIHVHGIIYLSVSKVSPDD